MSVAHIIKNGALEDILLLDIPFVSLPVRYLVPKYLDIDFQIWSNSFIIQLPIDLNSILDDSEVPNLFETLPAGTDDYIKIAVKKHDAAYCKRNKLIYQLLHEAFSSSTGCLAIISSEDVKFNGRACWRKLDVFFNEATQQNKMQAVQDIFKIKFEQGTDSPMSFKFKVQKCFTRLKSLETKLEDLQVVLFLLALPSEYSLVVNIILQRKGELNLELVACEVAAAAQRVVIQSDIVKANVAASPVNLQALVAAEVAKQRPIQPTQRPERSRRGHDSHRNANPRSDRPILQCTRCQRTGHTADKCYAAPRRDNKGSDRPHHKKQKYGPSSHMATVEHAFMANLNPNISSPMSKSVTMLADSGASCHIIQGYYADGLTNTRAVHVPIQVASGDSMVATVKGDYGSLRDVLCVPKMGSHNLFSVGHACARGNVAVFTDKDFALYLPHQLSVTGKPILTGPKNGNTYEVTVDQKPTQSMQSVALVASVKCANNFTLWHRRLGHCSSSTLKTMLHAGSVHGLQFTKNEVKEHLHGCVCTGCAFGKLDFQGVRRLAPGVHTYTVPVELKVLAVGRKFVLDLLLTTEKSLGGHTQALIIVEAESRFTWVILQKAKSDTGASLKVWLETMITKNIVVSGLTSLESDNGLEFLAEDTQTMIRERGIGYSRCAPYSHVPKVERAIRTIQGSARAMLLGSGRSILLWGEALMCAAHVTNRLPNKANTKVTKFELLNGTKPSVAHLRTFGCTAFASVQTQKKKWDPRSVQGIFCGYGDTENSNKTYRFYDPKTRNISLTRNIIFDEGLAAGPQPEDHKRSIWGIFSNENFPARAESHLAPAPLRTIAVGTGPHF